jgi:hypothetical protein
VCAVGVGALYLVPSIAGTPARFGEPGSGGEPQSIPRPVSYLTQSTPGATQTSRPGAAAPSPVITRTVTVGAGAPTGADARNAERVGRGGVAVDQPDREPPATVADLSFPSVGPDAITIRWQRADDNVAVVGYRVWLNGFRVADTGGLQVTVPWFNDGTRQQVVQVRAVDAAGNESIHAPAHLVRRPAPTPAPAAAGTPGTDPTPSVSINSPAGSIAKSVPSGSASTTYDGNE